MPSVVRGSRAWGRRPCGLGLRLAGVVHSEPPVPLGLSAFAYRCFSGGCASTSRVSPATARFIEGRAEASTGVGSMLCSGVCASSTGGPMCPTVPGAGATRSRWPPTSAGGRGHLLHPLQHPGPRPPGLPPRTTQGQAVLGPRWSRALRGSRADGQLRGQGGGLLSRTPPLGPRVLPRRSLGLRQGRPHQRSRPGGHSRVAVALPGHPPSPAHPGGLPPRGGLV